MDSVVAASALGPAAATSGSLGMEELMPLVLQLTNAEQVRLIRRIRYSMVGSCMCSRGKGDRWPTILFIPYRLIC
jgi:hypothetical protein